MSVIVGRSALVVSRVAAFAVSSPITASSPATRPA